MIRLKSASIKVVLGAALLPMILSAQAPDSRINVPRSKVADTFSEMETGDMTLRFFNALTGEGIPDALVKVEGLGDSVSDFEGKVALPMPEDGLYKVTFVKTGFITSEFEIEVMAGSLFFNRFSISPDIPLGSLRIVLDWDKKPADLDIHFKKNNGYHISYRNMKVAEDGAARLDRDDTDSYGPETITADLRDSNGAYVCFVHDYTNKGQDKSQALSNSKACVKIYSNNALLHVVQVPKEQVGTYWSVFTISSGQITVQELVLNVEPVANISTSIQTR